MKIAVYSAAAPAHSAEVAEAATAFTTWCAAQGHTLISGGSGYGGLMTLLAESMLNAGGAVHTIYMPWMHDHSARSHPALTHQHVPHLSARLHEMLTQADAFVAFPGGIGTLHEVMHTWADGTLAKHGKKLHLLNLGGFFTPLQSLIEHTVAHTYTSPARAAQAHVHPSVAALTQALTS